MHIREGTTNRVHIVRQNPNTHSDLFLIILTEFPAISAVNGDQTRHKLGSENPLVRYP
jgi:hypothetical protein